jgi:hypothetical protein
LYLLLISQIFYKRIFSSSDFEIARNFVLLQLLTGICLKHRFFYFAAAVEPIA